MPVPRSALPLIVFCFQCPEDLRFEPTEGETIPSAFSRLAIWIGETPAA